MSAETYIAKTVENASDAIATHVRWKISLTLAARMHEPLTPRATRAIQHPEECAIHKWLLSQHTLHLRGTPEYRVALDLHHAFHGQMLAIGNLINAADYEQAERLLNSPEHFEKPSLALANALMALDRIPASQPSPRKNAPASMRKTA